MSDWPPLDARLRIRDGFHLDQVDGELIAYFPPMEQLVRLNATGAAVWALCDGSRTVAELLDVLEGSWPEQAEAVRKETLLLLRQLRAHHVFERP